MKFSDIKKSDKKEFNALLEQVVLIFNGASNNGMTVELWNDEWICGEQLVQVMGAIKATYDIDLKYYDVMYFEKPARATLFLFDKGVRALNVGSFEDISFDMNGE